MIKSANTRWVVKTGSSSKTVIGPDPPTTGIKQLLSSHHALEGRMTGLESHIATCNISSQEIRETLSDIQETLGSLAPQILQIQHRCASPDPEVMDRLEHLQFRMEDTETATTDFTWQMAAQQSQITCMVTTTNTLAASLEGQRRELLALRARNDVQSQEVQVGTSLAASPVCPNIALLPDITPGSLEAPSALQSPKPLPILPRFHVPSPSAGPPSALPLSPFAWSPPQLVLPPPLLLTSTTSPTPVTIAPGAISPRLANRDPGAHLSPMDGTSCPHTHSPLEADPPATPTPGGPQATLPSIPKVPEPMDIDEDRGVGSQRSQNQSDMGSTAEVGMVLPSIIPAVQPVLRRSVHRAASRPR
jgi:hypothetical protein